MEFTNGFHPEIPSVPGLPLVGSYLKFKKDNLAFLLDIAGVYGDMCVFHIGPRPILLINNPGYASAVLMDPGLKFTNRKPSAQSSLSPLLGQGVVYREGDAH